MISIAPTFSELVQGQKPHPINKTTPTSHTPKQSNSLALNQEFLAKTESDILHFELDGNVGADLSKSLSESAFEELGSCMPSTLPAKAQLTILREISWESLKFIIMNSSLKQSVLGLYTCTV